MRLDTTRILLAGLLWTGSLHGLGTAGGDSQYARPDLLMEPTQLAASASAGQFVILDARSQEEYDRGHVPGARRVDHDAWKGAFEDGKDAEGWSKRIVALGIGVDSKVVVYDDKAMKDAARIWWILRYWGVENARLLNGGWRGWQSAELPTTRATPAPASQVDFTATPRPNRLATMGQVLRLLRGNKLQIVDARSEDEFCGIDKRDNERGGAIPGAKHLEWSDLIEQETHRFKGPEKLRRLFLEADIDLAQPTASHCNGGGRAAVMAFGLELMGADDVRNYYRGWGEWGNSKDTPVIIPKQTQP
jgi:thiosulfate/3-mercaptopyruvate sulfurtransferase